MQKFLAAFVFMFASQVLAKDPLPLVEEHYDTLVLAHENVQDRDWTRNRIYFCRNKKVLAERSADEQMFWYVDAENGKLILEWDDYGVCHRIISFDNLVEISTEEDMNQQDLNPWFFMGRRMTDLKAPPTQP